MVYGDEREKTIQGARVLCGRQKQLRPLLGHASLGTKDGWALRESFTAPRSSSVSLDLHTPFVWLPSR